MANELFEFRQVLNGQTKKSVDDKGVELAPILFGVSQTNPGKIKNSRSKEIKILLDSGSSGCLVNAMKLGKIKTRFDNTNVWETAAGHISTMKMARLQLNYHNLAKQHLSITIFTYLKLILNMI